MSRTCGGAGRGPASDPKVKGNCRPGDQASYFNWCLRGERVPLIGEPEVSARYSSGDNGLKEGLSRGITAQIQRMVSPSLVREDNVQNLQRW